MSQMVLCILCEEISQEAHKMAYMDQERYIFSDFPHLCCQSDFLQSKIPIKHVLSSLRKSWRLTHLLECSRQIESDILILKVERCSKSSSIDTFDLRVASNKCAAQIARTIKYAGLCFRLHSSVCCCALVVAKTLTYM